MVADSCQHSECYQIQLPHPSDLSPFPNHCTSFVPFILVELFQGSCSGKRSPDGVLRRVC